MPWDNKNGGPWGSGGGSGGNGGGPWGSGPKKPGGGGSQPPDLEDLLKKTQDGLKNVLPSGRGGNSLIALIALVAIGFFWVMQSVYTVEQNELGQELVFGKPKDDVSQAGLHFAWWPVETVEKVLIVERREKIGAGSGGRSTSNDAGLMLSGDQNIVDVEFTILWRVSAPKDFLFNVRDPQELVKQVSESAMREVVGRRPSADVFRRDRIGIAADVLDIVQATLDSYKAGISITGVNLEDAAPPREVADAFEEVQRAQQDQDRFQKEAEAYSSRVLGEARGHASQIRQQAEGYKQSTIAQATGEASRFVAVLQEYDKAKDVTRKRLYLETLERVLRDSNKVILESGAGAGGSGVVPYLPLNELQRPRTTAKEAGQ